MNALTNDETRSHIRMAFAALAMQSLIQSDTTVGCQAVARSAVNYADALIAELMPPLTAPHA